jgi:hypothetical protein
MSEKKKIRFLNEAADLDLNGNNILNVNGISTHEVAAESVIIGVDTGARIEPAGYEGDNVVLEFYGSLADERAVLRYLADPVLDVDAATKGYVDEAVANVATSGEVDLSGYLKTSGGEMSGEIKIGKGDGNGIQLGVEGFLNATKGADTKVTVLGVDTNDNNPRVIFGSNQLELRMRGSLDRPQYSKNANFADPKALALLEDVNGLANNTLSLSGGTMTGDLNLNNNNLTNVGYTGTDTLATGQLRVWTDVNDITNVTPSAETDSAGQRVTVLNFAGGKNGEYNTVLRGVAQPNDDTDAVNKKYLYENSAGARVGGKEFTLTELGVSNPVTAATGAEIFNDYNNNIATGHSAHAEGYMTSALGNYGDHAEGNNCVASGTYGAHAEGFSCKAYGKSSHAEGEKAEAAGRCTHAEGNNTYASGSCSHAEGVSSRAIGSHSHAEGNNTATWGANSHAEGLETWAYGDSAHAEGSYTIACGTNAHAEGFSERTNVFIAGAAGATTYTVSQMPENIRQGDIIRYLSGETCARITGYNKTALSINVSNTLDDSRALATAAAIIYSGAACGDYSHSEGNCTIASGDYSHSEGKQTIASGDSSHAEGSAAKASGRIAHAEGFETLACGDYSHSEGERTEADGEAAHAEGLDTIAGGAYSHAEGGETTTGEDAMYAHAEGNLTVALGVSSHAEGVSSRAIGSYSHAEGEGTEARGSAAHAEGSTTQAYGNYSHAEGYCTVANLNAHAEGYFTTAYAYQHVQGHYSNADANAAGTSAGTTGTAFMIGNGAAANSRSNAVRITYDGQIFAKKSTINTGADYAEYFEWADLNPEAEDRRGYFVTMTGKQIKFAAPGDYVLGIVSGQPAIIGNGDEEWLGRYVFDEFGAFVYEDFEYEVEEPVKVVNEETGETTIEIKKVIKIGKKYKENPDYDPTKSYIQREDRPEWSAVGMLGVLSVRDDGTCQVDGYCAVADGGIATAAEAGYRVIERVNDHIVKVIFR